MSRLGPTATTRRRNVLLGLALLPIGLGAMIATVFGLIVSGLMVLFNDTGAPWETLRNQMLAIWATATLLALPAFAIILNLGGARPRILVAGVVCLVVLPLHLMLVPAAGYAFEFFGGLFIQSGLLPR